MRTRLAAPARLKAELAQLRQWKWEATEVIRDWERVWEALDRPGVLGESKARVVLELITRDEHRIEFRDDGWLIFHPPLENITCTLRDCELLQWRDLDPGVRGTYVLTRDEDGTLIIGDRVED